MKIDVIVDSREDYQQDIRRGIRDFNKEKIRQDIFQKTSQKDIMNHLVFMHLVITNY